MDLFLLRELAARNGLPLNASAIGRRLRFSCNTVIHRINLLEEAGTIRVLPSLAGRAVMGIPMLRETVSLTSPAGTVFIVA